MEAVERFEMPQPIPPYLFAFAVGEPRRRASWGRARGCGPSRRSSRRAAWEFAGVDDMLDAAETLFGPYDWERFDLLTMPPSFPYGGMENPRLTFLTPTLLAGDRSLVNVVAHELAHSWTGNLVTNASRRALLAQRGLHRLRRAPHPRGARRAGGGGAARGAGAARAGRGAAPLRASTRSYALRTHLTGIDPDEAFSQVPYEKGYLFLRALEEAVGRAALRRLPAHATWRSSASRRSPPRTSSRFAESELPGALAKVDADAYLNRPGVPESAPAPRSGGWRRCEQLAARCPRGGREGLDARPSGSSSWSRCRGRVQRVLRRARRAVRAHRRAATTRCWWRGWCRRCARATTLPLGRGRGGPGEVGRMKYLKPLYSALASSREHRKVARAAFEKHGARYHPIARQGVELILARA